MPRRARISPNLPQSPRKEAIERLAEEDPTLPRRWLDYRAAQDRLAHYAKSSGHFTRTRSEANTYVMFTEVAAGLAGNRGEVSILAKSGIAIDAAQSAVWRSLVMSGRVWEVRDIVNGGPTGATPIFPGVSADPIGYRCPRCAVRHLFSQPAAARAA